MNEEKDHEPYIVDAQGKPILREQKKRELIRAWMRRHRMKIWGAVGAVMLLGLELAPLVYLTLRQNELQQELSNKQNELQEALTQLQIKSQEQLTEQQNKLQQQLTQLQITEQNKLEERLAERQEAFEARLMKQAASTELASTLDSFFSDIEARIDAEKNMTEEEKKISDQRIVTRTQILLSSLREHPDKAAAVIRFVAREKAALFDGKGGLETNPEYISLQEINLQKTDMSYVLLEGAFFKNAQLEGAFFKNAQLEGASFGNAQLEGVNFRSAQLERADFCYAQLKGASFGGAQLEGADFRSAQLERADFWYAQLEGADFRRAQLEGAEFVGAQLEGANFRTGEDRAQNIPPEIEQCLDVNGIYHTEENGGVAGC